MTLIDQTAAARALLRWYLDAGVDEAVADEPRNFFERREAAPMFEVTKVERAAAISVIAPKTGPSADEAIELARRAAASCQTIEALAEAVAAFEGCALKQGARNTVFADGVHGAPLLVIGEAPGRDEDLVGKPFDGRAGQLLDRMLAAIGRSRSENVLISNVIYWRPPGNRTPSPEEMAICRPFVERLIELSKPKAIALAGNAPMQALTGATGIMRARGQWREIALASGARVEALAMFHPAFLLRQPAQKRLAWQDLQTLAARLRED